MPQDRTCYQKAGNAPLARFALGAVLAAFVVCANTAARAGDDGTGDDRSFMDKFMHTLGLKWPGDDDGISYTERSPLVVPPTRDLPKPMAAAPTPAPNWPKDPDVKRRVAAKKSEKPRYQTDYASEANRPLRPDELDVPGAPRPSPTAGNSQQTDANPPEPPKKSIFSLSWFKKEEYATFTGEPSRAALTDPPPGYLTPSPDQPYGIAPEHKVAKPQTLGERMEIQR